jgi:hypothetical protein
MKKYIGFFILYLSFPLLGNTSFEWYEGEKWALSRVNLVSKVYEVKGFNEIWVKKCDLIFEGINHNEIPVSASPLAFNFRKSILFSIPGTGQVYQFDKNRKVFRRLDKTFFRGYNFHALQFVKSDTLFSLGGEGFWRSQSILSYFDFKNREWEELKTTGEIPGGVLSIHAGLNMNQTKVFTMEAFQPGNFQVPHLGFFELDLFTHVWKKKGELDFYTFKKLGQSTANFNLLGNLMFFSDPQLGYYANPETNQLYKYVGPRKLFFLIESKLFQRSKMLFSMHLDKNDPKGLLKLDSMSLRELGENSQLIGEFYTVRTFLSKPDFQGYILGLLLLTSVLINLKLLFKKKRITNNSYAISLPPGGESFIGLFLAQGGDYLVGTEEISVLLGCEKKAFDTQRQYRAQFIISMNQYFAENFHIEEAVVRKASEVDKRIMKYGLKADAFQIIKTLPDSSKN